MCGLNAFDNELGYYINICVIFLKHPMPLRVFYCFVSFMLILSCRLCTVERFRTVFSNISVPVLSMTFYKIAIDLSKFLG